MSRTWAALSLSLALGACATSPAQIGTSYISPLQYAQYDCAQLRQEMHRVSARVQAMVNQQRRDANRDALAVTAGMVVFWPALFLMSGRDNKEEIASLKGQYEAVEQAAIQSRCSLDGATAEPGAFAYVPLPLKPAAELPPEDRNDRRR
jgi:hypothetical protein